MTNAARPTWHPAVGGNSLRDTGRAPCLQVSSKDVVVEAPLKLRRMEEKKVSEADTARLRLILEQKERENYLKKHGLTEDTIDEEAENRKRMVLLEVPDLDADEFVGDHSSERGDGEDDADGSSDSEESSDGGLSEDEEAELRRELEKVKREREEERLAALNEKAKEEDDRHEKWMLESNSLLVPETNDFSVSRKWYDDTIFKNQAKKISDTPKKRFVSDMLRSEFHKKFMNRYIR